MKMACVVCNGTRTRRLFEKGGKSFLRCSGCGLVRVDPLPTPSELTSYYEQTYDQGIYAPYAAAEGIRQLIAAHRLRAIHAFVRPGRWLDVGCATGQFIEGARRAGMEAEGLDVAPGAVARARARGLIAHVGRAEDFSPSAPYDTITAFDVIEHTLDPGRFLDHVARWLLPDGALVLTLPDVSSIYPRLLMRRHWYYYAPNDHFYYFSPATMRRLLIQRGFTVQRVSWAYKPLTLAYVVAQLSIFNPRLGRLAALLARPLPRQFLAQPWKCYVGEMMAIASKRAYALG